MIPCIDNTPYIQQGSVVFFKHRMYKLSWKYDPPVPILTNSRNWDSYYLEPRTLGNLYNYVVKSIDTNKIVGIMDCYMRGIPKTPWWH